MIDAANPNRHPTPVVRQLFPALAFQRQVGDEAELFRPGEQVVVRLGVLPDLGDRGDDEGDGFMVAFADPISNFVEKNPSIKVLALSFLILIGALLVAEGFGQHIDKGYIYSAMAFAVIIEFINMPASLSAQYQNYTQAEMTTLRSLGYTTPATSLEAGVKQTVEWLDSI